MTGIDSSPVSLEEIESTLAWLSAPPSRIAMLAGLAEVSGKMRSSGSIISDLLSAERFGIGSDWSYRLGAFGLPSRELDSRSQSLCSCRRCCSGKEHVAARPVLGRRSSLRSDNRR